MQPSASGISTRLARVLTDMEIIPVMILCRIDTNTGECRRGVNAAKQIGAKQMGRSYVDSTPQNLNEELKCHANAIAANPDNADSWNRQAAVLLDLYRYDDALLSTERALSLAPA